MQPAFSSDLDQTQGEAVAFAISGANVFLTGGPGVGKSHTLKAIIAALKDKLGQNAVLSVAPTGAAALLVDGQTINAFPGPGVPEGTVEAFHRMTQGKRATTWRKIKALVIDEVSMVDGEFFDWYMASLPCTPQVIVCGDFFQLSPICGRGGSSLLDPSDEAMYIAKSNENCVSVESAEEWIAQANVLAGAGGPWFPPEQTTPYGLAEMRGRYAFQSKAWARLNLRVVCLSRVYRATDEVLNAALQDIRMGSVNSDRVDELLRMTSQNLVVNQGIRPTVIVPTRQGVSQINDAHLNDLDVAAEQEYVAVDSATPDGPAGPWVMRTLEGDSFFRDCPAVATLRLRVGAQVMLVRNEQPDEGKLVNGSRGVVVAFRPPDCQIARHFGPYNTLDTSVPVGDADDVASHASASTSALYPVVRFVDGSCRLLAPFEFRKKVYGSGVCKRKQIPLALAWAMTVHKAQGASLDFVTVDLEGAFVAGQAYVAISRARSIDGLQIRNYNASTVTTTSIVRDFYDAIERDEMEAFLSRENLWWGSDLFLSAHSRWLSLFCRHPTFRSWT